MLDLGSSQFHLLGVCDRLMPPDVGVVPELVIRVCPLPWRLGQSHLSDRIRQVAQRTDAAHRLRSSVAPSPPNLPRLGMFPARLAGSLQRRVDTVEVPAHDEDWCEGCVVAG